MGIEAQKSALPALVNFARVRAAPQPHVCSDLNPNTITDTTILEYIPKKYQVRPLNFEFGAFLFCVPYLHAGLLSPRTSPIS